MTVDFGKRRQIRPLFFETFSENNMEYFEHCDNDDKCHEYSGYASEHYHPLIVHAASPGQTGMFPCLRAGSVCRLPSNMVSAEQSRALVWAGSITSST